MVPLRAVLVTPLSGPLARFGRAGAAALRLWAMREPGVPAPWTAVDLEVIDTYPSASAAMRTATSWGSDVLFGSYGSGPAVAALQATRRVVWKHGGGSTPPRPPTLAPP